MKPTKIIALLTILALSASAMLIAFSSGVLAAIPSVPEFTLAYVDHSYDVPITRWTTTDPYTGAQVSHSSGGEHVDNRTIDVTIKNQPFSAYNDPNSNQTVNLYYNIRSKGHFETWSGDSDLGSHSQTGLQASTSTYTVVSFSLQYWSIPQGGQLDFEVKAITGFTYYNSQACGTQYQNTVGDSGWSDAQTITIGTPIQSSPRPSQPISTPNQPNPTFNPYLPTASPISPNPTATPSLPNILTDALAFINLEQTALVVMAVVIAVLAIALIVVLKRRGTAK